MSSAVTSRLRKLLAADDLLVLPGAPDALTARIAAQVGFAAVYATGAGFANAGFGLPDVGLIGLSEVVTHIQRMTDVIDIPVVVDADTGYGGLLSARRTVRALERAGAAAVQLEDQVAPKRCGHFDGQQVVAVEDMVALISIAVDSRQDEDLVIIARTDARGAEGLEAAIERANIYREAGADAIFVEAPRTEEEVRSLPRLIDAPLIANVVEGGKTPNLPAGELAACGYRIALYANTALRASMLAVRKALTVLRDEHDTASLADRMVSWQQRQSTVGLDELQAMENRYLSDAIAFRKRLAERSESASAPGADA